MRRITLLLSMVGLAAGGAVGAMACGGDDDASVPVVTPGDAATSSGGETGASSSSGSPSNPDASSSSSSGGSTPSSNPGQLTCGATACDAGGGGGGGAVCCARPTGEGTCTRENDCDNDGPDGGISLECDEAADCDDGDRCCFITERDNNRIASSTQCRGRCATGGGGGATARPQVCKTSAECGDGGACTQKTCGGFKLFVCGTPEGCN